MQDIIEIVPSRAILRATRSEILREISRIKQRSPRYRIAEWKRQIDEKTAELQRVRALLK